MNFPDWRQRLVRSLHLHRSKAEAKYFQVASVDRYGHAQNRTMVFRNFEDKSNQLLSVSDVRSEKIVEWLHTSDAQLCWYFTKTREQYRISANITLILSEQARKALLQQHKTMRINPHILEESETSRKNMWDSLSTTARAQFSWPHPKQTVSKTCNSNNDNIVENNTFTSILDEDSENSAKIPDTFVLIKFIPYRVDYLDLKTNPQTRILQSLVPDRDKWQLELVNP